MVQNWHNCEHWKGILYELPILPWWWTISRRMLMTTSSLKLSKKRWQPLGKWGKFSVKPISSTAKRTPTTARTIWPEMGCQRNRLRQKFLEALTATTFACPQDGKVSKIFNYYFGAQIDTHENDMKRSHEVGRIGDLRVRVLSCTASSRNMQGSRGPN